MSNTGGVYTWSKTPANNATFDNTVNYAEGQAPSSLNDSARNAMTSVAKWRDDIGGVIVTTGISVAYIVASNQGFDTLANFHGQMIAFSPHVTNGAGPVTMTVDTFANLPVRTAPGKELQAGVLIQGTPYVAMYNNTDGSLYLQGFYGNPYNVPLYAGMDYWDTIAPNSSFIFPAGQAINRTTYAAAFARWGTTYGAGDGSTTFNVPDKTERVSVMKAAAASRLTATYFGGNSANMGAVGGSESHTLTTPQIPSITSVNPAQAISVSSTFGDFSRGSASSADFGGAQPALILGSLSSVASSGSNSISVTSNNTGGGAHNNTQPTIVCNYIIRLT